MLRLLPGGIHARRERAPRAIGPLNASEFLPFESLTIAQGKGIPAIRR